MVAGVCGGSAGTTPSGVQRLRQRCRNPRDYLDVVPEDLQPMQEAIRAIGCVLTVLAFLRYS